MADVRRLGAYLNGWFTPRLSSAKWSCFDNLAEPPSCYYRQESSTAGHQVTESSYLMVGIPSSYRTRKAVYSAMSALRTQKPNSACFIINESALLVYTLLCLSVCLSVCVPRPRLSWSHFLTSSPGFPFRPASCLFSCPPFCFHSSNQYNYVLILHKF